MWIKSKIGAKLAAVIILVNIVALLILSFLFYAQFEKALNERILLQLTSIKKLKHRQIEDYLQKKLLTFNNLQLDLALEEQIQSLSEGDTLMIRDASNKSIFYKSFHIAFQSPSFSKRSETVFLDLSSSNPHKDLLVAFVRQIDDSRDLILLSSLKKVQEIVLERTGMGETGETYLVGNDFKMRSISRFFPEEKPLNIEVKTIGVEAALAGETGTGAFLDYRGVKVFSSYQPLQMYNLNWAILSEIDESEVYIPLSSMKNNLAIIGAVIFLVMLFLSFFVSQAIVRPVVKMRDVLNEMALGKISPINEKFAGSDEIGQMFLALEKHIHALKRVTDFADLIGSQKFDEKYELLSPEDALGVSLMQMRDKLNEYKNKEVIYRREKQKALWQGQEKERARLAKELHDGLGPLLTTLKLSVSGISMSEHDKEKLKKQLDETITEVRHVAYNLMPQALLDFGVGNALGNLIDIISKISDISIRYVNSMKPKSRLSQDVNIGIYRIAQEALNNALKYSKASEIKISLTEFDEYVSFFIKDNGKGFDTTEENMNGTGLLNMKERARALNGSFVLESSKEGTSIEVEIPINNIL